MSTENKAYLKVVQYVKENINNGKFILKDKLPTEREMSVELKLSRNSVREALRTMENMGIIESRQGSGNYLVGKIGKNFTQSLSMMILLKEINYLDINQMRRAIELQSFYIAINNMNESQLLKIKGIIDKLEDASGEEELKLDNEFHNTIIGLSNNLLMQSIMQSISDICQDDIKYNLMNMTQKEKKQIKKCHKDIYNALINDDIKLGIKSIIKHYDLIDVKALM